MPKISVIVPIYNVSKYIAKCVKSLFEQTLDDIEYIFVDDCSPDNSIDILRSIIINYPARKNQVKIVRHSTNKGLSAARMTGISEATGTYLTFCDSDDYIGEDMYATMYDMAINRSADIVACGMSVISDSGELQDIMLFGVDELRKEDLTHYSQIEGGIYSSLCNKIIRRSLLINYSIMPNEGITMWEDLYISLRARFFANKMCVVDKPFYNYIMRSESIIHATNIYKKVNSQVLCVSLLERFFVECCYGRECDLMIAYLKLLSKESLIGVDHKLWISIFPEANKYIVKFREYYGGKKTLKYLILGYGRNLGCVILRIITTLKNIIK